jgi:(p)ppGpp synthase/HD superfamily hydrolase
MISSSDHQHKLTSRFEDALVFATHLHRKQVRKGTNVPYVAHLLAVTALVLENGGDEDQAIAALLHDAVEDQGGLKTLREIEERFGKRVAFIVDGCTDSYEIPKPPWRERKEAYLDHLAVAPPEVGLVSLADKVHNARSILSDLIVEGESIWDQFNGGKDGTLWYYRSLVKVFNNTFKFRLIDEFTRLVAEIEREAAAPSG